MEKRAAKLAHGVLYLLMLMIFLSGYLISTADDRGIDVFDWFTVPSMGELIDSQEDIAGLVHEYLAYTLIAMVVLHALAALKHHFIDKDNVLKRMVKPTKI
jgi:cytochrome b561